MSKRNIYILLFSLLLFTKGMAQVSSGGRPFYFKQTLHKLQAKEIIAKPVIPSQPLLKSAQMDIKFKTLKFATPINTGFTPYNSGEWFQTEDGTSIWRLHIQSKDAASLNLIFTKYHLPEGARLFIFSPNGDQVLGAYTSANNKKTGILPTMPILGDELIVEYSEPSGVAFKADLEIGKVNYDFYGIQNALATPLPGEFGSSQFCEEEASCFADWGVEDQSVVKIIVDGTELCTGSLIANTSRDNTPYVLTAAHCFEEYSYQVSTTLFIFNYECPNCLAGIEGTREQSVAGGYMRAYSEIGTNKDLDYALVEMSVLPPPSYDAYYSGWDVRDLQRKQLATIHHPSGDVKKLSMDYDSVGTVTLKVGDFTFFSQGHWRVYNWEIGSTEGGSSGAALFNSDKRIMGGLSAGAATCDNPINDFFFRLSLAWDSHPVADQQLKYWLDSDNTGETWMDGYQPSYGTRIGLYSNLEEGDSLGFVRLKSNVGQGYLSGDNSINVTRYAERFSIKDSFKVHGFYFVPFLGKNTVTTPVTFKIWDGESLPENELWSMKLELYEWIRRQKVDQTNFGTTGGYYIKSSYADKECFINITDEVLLKDNLFIGYEMSASEPADTFAMYQVIDRTAADNNTSYFYKDGEWKAFTDYAGQPIQTSLWISAVVELTSVITDTTPPSTPNDKLIKSIFSTADKQHFTVLLNAPAKEDIMVQGYSSNGSKVMSQIIEQNKLSSEINFSKSVSGVFILRFAQKDKTETYKIIVLPQ